jgi:putative metallohydrolase (TIGR04338 family)
MNKDPQQDRVYDMENVFMRAWVRSVQQPLTLLQEYADRACRRWNVKTIPVRFAFRKNGLGMHYAGEYIELYRARSKKRSGRNLAVLLHEVAHHIDDCIWDSEESHGPKFCAVEMDLLDHYGILPHYLFKSLADTHGVKIAKLDKRKPA